VFLLRPGRIISLAILVAIVGGAWWAWGRVHRSDPPSEAAAIAAVARAKGTLAGMPKAGVWRFSAAGDEKIGFGPLSVARDLPTRALVAVTPLKDGERSVETQLSADHAEAWHVTPSSEGLVGTFREVRVGTVGYTANFSGKTTPSVLLFPKRLHGGQTWKRRYAVTGIVFQRDSKVLRRETIVVGGVAVKAWVVATTETLTGAVHGKDVFKEWWSPELGLAIRTEWRRSFAGTVINLMTLTLTLDSILPRR
jgi:hypothetical protein